MAELQQTEPAITSRLLNCLQVVRGMITDAINAAGVQDPLMVLIGYPTWTEGLKVWGQPVDPGYVTIDALADSRIVTRYRPEWGQVSSLVTAFSATFTDDSATFAQIVGSPTPAGTNVFLFFTALSGGNYAAQYTTVANETPSSLATAVANAVNALSVSGVSASPSGNVVNVTGANVYAVNVGGTAIAEKEVARVSRTMRVSIWVNSPWSRFGIQDAISTQLGAIDNCWLTLPSGARFLVLPKMEGFNDDSQESTNLWITHMTYTLEYGVVQTGTAAQIGAISVDQIMKNEAGVQFADQTYLIS